MKEKEVTGQRKGGRGGGDLPSEVGGVLLDGRLAPPPLAIMTINKGHWVNGRPV